MAKHLDKFFRAFRQSRIPFLLVEVITDGHGDMVDLACRFANSAAGALLETPAEELTGQRFTRRFPSQRLSGLKPLQNIAFSGSAASFSYTSVLGRALEVTCYQAMYGIVGCILEPQADARRNPSELLTENLPGAVAVLELSRAGLRCLSFNRRLCTLSGWERKELLDRFAQDFSALVEPADWPDLLQDLLDAARDSRPVAHELRLLQKDGASMWVDLRAELLSSREGVSTFYAVLLDIDQRRRTQSRLRETLGQLETAQDQLSALFDHLPGSYCLLRLEEDGTAVPLRASRGLADLLGYSVSELLRHLAADPLWAIPPDGRDNLIAAAKQAWTAGQPLCHACQLQHKGGLIWVSLEGACQPQADGTSLLYIACSPLDRERAAKTELAFRAQLCELLLDRSAILLLDYDPAEDTAHIEYFDRTGRRTQRTAGAYLSSLGRSGTVHPADQKRLLSAVKRAATRPVAELVEFRGDYDGAGWRWYQVSWLRSIDEQGNVTRLVGKGVDVTAQKTAAQRFQRLKVQQRKLPPGALASAQLDLTDDRILDAKGSNRYLSRVLFGNTADACLRHLRDSVPGEDPRRQFDERFRREALLGSFRQGETHFSLEHPFSPDPGGPVWARTELTLAETPEDGHVTAFCTVWNSSPPPDPVLEALARRYDFVLTMNANGGSCRSYGGRNPLPSGSTYRALAARYVRDHVSSSRQRAAIRQAARLETVLSQLETRAVYEFTCTVDTADGPQRKQLCCSWLDRDADILLVTLGGV